MKRHLLLSAVAACLALPTTALADPPTDPQRGADRADHGKDTPKGKAADKARHEGTGPRVQTPAAPEHAARPAAPPAQQARAPAERAQAPVRRDQAPARQAQAPVQQVQPPAQRAQPPAQRAQARPPAPARVQPQAVAPPATLSLGDWRAPARGPARDRAGQQWRQEHQSWDRYAAWRRSPDWWRNDGGFRLFVGPRVGFYFVPQIGYVSVPRQYRNRHWREGDYLPRWFRAYTVSHYERYGLPRPPRGCVWIWLNGDIALIDRSDGYILDIARNAWR